MYDTPKFRDLGLNQYNELMRQRAPGAALEALDRRERRNPIYQWLRNLMELPENVAHLEELRLRAEYEESTYGKPSKPQQGLDR